MQSWVRERARGMDEACGALETGQAFFKVFEFEKMLPLVLSILAPFGVGTVRSEWAATRRENSARRILTTSPIARHS